MTKAKLGGGEGANEVPFWMTARCFHEDPQQRQEGGLEFQPEKKRGSNNRPLICERGRET